METDVGHLHHFKYNLQELARKFAIIVIELQATPRKDPTVNVGAL